MNEEYKMEGNQLLDSELAEVTGGIDIDEMNAQRFKGRRRGDYVLFISAESILFMGRITGINTVYGQATYEIRILAQSLPPEVKNYIGLTTGGISDSRLEESLNYVAQYSGTELYGAQGQMINISLN